MTGLSFILISFGIQHLAGHIVGAQSILLNLTFLRYTAQMSKTIKVTSKAKTSKNVKMSD